MKKIFLSFGLIVVFAIFATVTRRNVGVGADSFLAPNVSILNNGNVNSGQLATTQSPTTSSGGANPPAQTSQTSVVPTTPVKKKTPNSPAQNSGGSLGGQATPTPAPAPKQLGQYKDGTYTGPTVDAYYGYIQVQAVVSGGKLTDVIFLQYPSDRRTSVQINSQAMPYLKQEAIQAQSANVNIISGASDSSGAFIQSLGAALAMAAN
jgi:uncharacterized protein with FMN-binding domain